MTGTDGDGDLPGWLRPLAAAVRTAPAEYYSRFLPPPGEEQRMSAVLALFGETEEGQDLLFIERAATLRSHAGQPAFPGGKVDPEDASPVAAALREAREEVGVDPESVHVFATLPPLFLPPSGFTVVTVLGWWRTPHLVHAVDANEVARVERVPVAELVDPANRCRVGLRNGWEGPGFRVRDLVIWGFTAGLVDKLIALGGWERDWRPGEFIPRPITDPAAAAGVDPVPEEVARGG